MKYPKSLPPHHTPLNDATALEPDTTVSATFSLQMDPLLMSTATFTLETMSKSLAGSVVYNENSDFSATFTPLNKLALVTEYTATLSPGVSSLLGAVFSEDHQWRFTTRDGTWQTATVVGTNDDGDAGSPQVAIGSNGNAMAVWSQSDGTRWNVWANRFE